jgi:hypothetical protein
VIICKGIIVHCTLFLQFTGKASTPAYPEADICGIGEGAVDQEEYDEMLRTLVRIAAHQETINQDQRILNMRLVAAIERIDTAIERLDITTARVETLLARMLRHEDNGHDVCAGKKKKREATALACLLASHLVGHSRCRTGNQLRVG